MNKTIAVLLLSIAGVAAASAEDRHHDFFGGHWGHEHHGRGDSVSAPEIDPSSAISALTLLLGGVTVLRSRFGRK